MDNSKKNFLHTLSEKSCKNNVEFPCCFLIQLLSHFITAMSTHTHSVATDGTKSHPRHFCDSRVLNVSRYCSSIMTHFCKRSSTVSHWFGVSLMLPIRITLFTKCSGKHKIAFSAKTSRNSISIQKFRLGGRRTPNYVPIAL